MAGRRFWRSLRPVLPAALILGSLVVEASPAAATLPGFNGRIACWSRHTVPPGPGGPAATPSQWDVLAFNPDGSDPRNLTNNPYADIDPMYTPDGRQILFVSGRDNDESEVFMMNHDGTNVRQIVDNDAIDDRPFSFSPDGTQAVFQTNRHGAPEIYRMNADGSNQVRLTNNPASDASPDWSPNGRRIAFQSNRSGDTDIYTMNPDGTDVRRGDRPSRVPTPFPDGRPMRPS